MTGVDEEDPLTADFAGAATDFTSNLTADGLEGKRVGVIRSYYGAGSSPAVEEILTSSIAVIKAQGGIVIDDIMLETEGMGAAEGTVLDYEFKADLAAYFERSAAPFATLADIIAFNETNAATVMPIFGQNRMTDADESGDLEDQEYRDALETSKRISQTAIDSVLAKHKLDILIAPTNGPAWLTDHINGDSFQRQ